MVWWGLSRTVNPLLRQRTSCVATSGTTLPAVQVLYVDIERSSVCDTVERSPGLEEVTSNTKVLKASRWATVAILGRSSGAIEQISHKGLSCDRSESEARFGHLRLTRHRGRNCGGSSGERR